MFHLLYNVFLRLRATVTFMDWITVILGTVHPDIQPCLSYLNQWRTRSLHFISYIHCQAQVQMPVTKKPLLSNKESLLIHLKNSNSKKNFKMSVFNEAATMAPQPPLHEV